jgi:hypothetical protein
MRQICAATMMFLALVLAAGSVSAQGDEAEGRRRWKHGQDLYDQGRYLDAAREFESGYAIAPRPLFYLSIGHAYRKAHELAKAKAAYEKLLTLQPDFPGRAEVEGYIKSINDALQVAEPVPPAGRQEVVTPRSGSAGQETAPGSLPAPPVAPQGDLSGPTSPYGSLAATGGPPMPSPAVPAPSIIETRPDSADSRSDSVVHKPWFWVIIGAVVAGGVAAVVIAAHPSSSCPGTICIRETRE